MKRTAIYDPENPKREGVLEFVCKLARQWGGRVVITVADPTRTLEQNARMWALLSDVARQVKWPVDGEMVLLSPDDWKQVFTAGLNREQRVAQGIGGGFVMLGQRTSQMTKREIGDLMELISAFGSERGVTWGEDFA